MSLLSIRRRPLLGSLLALVVSACTGGTTLPGDLAAEIERCRVEDHRNTPFDCLTALSSDELNFLRDLRGSHARDLALITDSVARADCVQARAWLDAIFASGTTLVYKGKYDTGNPPGSGAHIATTVGLSDGRRVIHVDPWVFRHVGTDIARAAVLRALLHEAVHVMMPGNRHEGLTVDNVDYVGFPVFSSLEARTEAKSCVAPFIPIDS